MKIKYKETTIGRERYRIVKCPTCGTTFNAYAGNNACCGIMYHCINESCPGKKKENLVSVPKGIAKEYILQDCRKRGFDMKKITSVLNSKVVTEENLVVGGFEIA